MKKNIIIIFTLLLFGSAGYSQESNSYYKYIAKAEQLYENENYLESGMTYSKAFETLGWKGEPWDIYNSACSWSLANVNDSAFVHLFKLANFSRDTELLRYIGLWQLEWDVEAYKKKLPEYKLLLNQ